MQETKEKQNQELLNSHSIVDTNAIGQMIYSSKNQKDEEIHDDPWEKDDVDDDDDDQDAQKIFDSTNQIKKEKSDSDKKKGERNTRFGGGGRRPSILR